ncbi:MAG TPA: hypothetical protein VNL13_09180 [Sulfolobales archaeon]|nr:hypothetical protein [Sulfolobales archaeon]
MNLPMIAMIIEAITINVTKSQLRIGPLPSKTITIERMPKKIAPNNPKSLKASILSLYIEKPP